MKAKRGVVVALFDLGIFAFAVASFILSDFNTAFFLLAILGLDALFDIRRAVGSR